MNAARWARMSVVVVAVVVSLASASSSSSSRGSARASLPPKGPMPYGATWEGRWTTSFGPLDLIQGDVGVQGMDVGGVYQYSASGRTVQGALVGKMDGNYLALRWSENNGARSGYAVFVMSQDGRSFSGTWGNGDSFDNGGTWTGQRAQVSSSVAPAASPPPGSGGQCKLNESAMKILEACYQAATESNSQCQQIAGIVVDELKKAGLDAALSNKFGETCDVVCQAQRSRKSWSEVRDVLCN